MPMVIVIARCPGMSSNGFAESLEHPGGNVTGMEELPPGVTAKRLVLLKTVAPFVSRVALLSTTPAKADTRHRWLMPSGPQGCSTSARTAAHEIDSVVQ
jgi:ABC-type uncharacterized transport system substrate-binding protein